jgi:hypothetical protein
MEAASKKLLEKSAAPSASRAVEGQCKPYAIRTEEAYVNWIRWRPFHNSKPMYSQVLFIIDMRQNERGSYSKIVTKRFERPKRLI